MSEHIKRISQSPKKPVSRPITLPTIQDHSYPLTRGQLTPSSELIMRLQTAGGNQFVQRFLRNINPIPTIQRVTLMKNVTTGPNDKIPVPIHHVESEAAARELLMRLSNGDASALLEMGVKRTVAADVDLQSHEWGLGFDKEEQKFLIVQGGPGAVNWGHFAGAVVGIDHTHPKAELLTDEEKKIEAIYADMNPDALGTNLLSVLKALDDETLQGLPNKEFIAIVPSASDLQFQYKSEKTTIENIFTAYKLHNGNISKTEGHQIVAEYGPTTVMLNTTPEVLIKQNKKIRSDNKKIRAENKEIKVGNKAIRAENREIKAANKKAEVKKPLKAEIELRKKKAKNTEQQVITLLCSPLKFMSNNEVVWSGWLYNDFINKGAGRLSIKPPPKSTYVRSQVRDTGVVMKE
jgi:hypothetical protein